MTSKAINNMLSLAIQHHQAGRLQLAESLYRQVLEIDPDNEEALHFLGVLAYQLEEYETAIGLIGKAIRINPNLAEAHYNLGKVFDSQDKANEAVDSYRRAITVNPNIAEAHYNLGIVLANQGKLDDAVASYQRTVAINPKDTDGWYNLGNALRDLGKTDDAIDAYRHALEINPRYVKAHNNMGILLKAQGKLDQAIACYERAIDIDPNYADTHYNFANALGDFGKLNEAILHYQRAAELDPDHSSPTHNNLGNTLGKLGKMNEAMIHYRRAIELDPDNVSAKHMVAAMTGETTEIAPPKYIKNLFDQSAAKFDYQLVEVLDYKSPTALRQALDNLLGNVHFRNAIDLGCGTGLSGLAFHQLIDRLTGIDLSPQMIELAKQRHIYDVLQTGDLVELLNKSEDKYDLFIATDVLVYIGNLRPLFKAIQSHALPGALFVCLTESIPEGTYILRQSGRYAHSRSHIQSLADEHHFTIEFCQPAAIRVEKGQGIMGDHMILKYQDLA